MPSFDYTFKVLMLGEASVGKTSLTKRYVQGIFNPDEKLTIGVDFYIKTVDVLDKKVKLQIWDLGGEQRFRFLLPTYCLGANATIFMYDITRLNTLENIHSWLSIVYQRSGLIPIMLVGSKLDLEKKERSVPREYGIQVAEENNLSGWIEISSKNNVNVDNVFETLCKYMLERAVKRSAL